MAAAAEQSLPMRRKMKALPALTSPTARVAVVRLRVVFEAHLAALRLDRLCSASRQLRKVGSRLMNFLPRHLQLRCVSLVRLQQPSWPMEHAGRSGFLRAMKALLRIQMRRLHSHDCLVNPHHACPMIQICVESHSRRCLFAETDDWRAMRAHGSA